MFNDIVSWVGTEIIRPGTEMLLEAGMEAALPYLTQSYVASPAAVIFGATSGAVAGTLIARHFWGETGQEHAIQLYTGQVSWDEYKSTVGEGMNITWNNIWS